MDSYKFGLRKPKLLRQDQEEDTSGRAADQAAGMIQGKLSPPTQSYGSGWQDPLNDTVRQILNREKFSYDVNEDALYHQYKDLYTMQGQQAMMDTMGQAATLTGGYGNSYAQTAGQQAYQGHIQKLGEVVPELYQLALDKYKMEGDQLYDQAAFLAQLDDRDYSRWADERDYQYQQGRDEKSDQQWQMQYDEDQRRYDQEWEEDKWRYDAEWEKKYGKKPDRGSDESADGESPAPTPAPTPQPQPEDEEPEPKETPNTNRFIAGMMTKDEAKRRGIMESEYFAMIRDKINNSGLSEGEIRYLLDHYGIG